MKRKYNRLIDILRKGHNNQTRDELLMVRYFAVKTAIKELKRCIEDTTRNGKRIRKERQAVMVKVLEVFYTYLHKSKTGQVNPSMRTIALLVNPNLQKPNRLDTPAQVKAKEKAIHATEMSVQRAIQTLQEIGMITVHQYYTDLKHFESNKNACFFYQLTPLSCYSRLYLDTREDKNGRKFVPKVANVVVPGRSTSTTIVIPKTIDPREERRKRKELKRIKEALEKQYQKDKALEALIIASCNDPNAKKIGTLSQILESKKKASQTETA